MYGARFSGRAAYRSQVWEVLTPFFSRWIPSTGAVLDLGAGYCEFINNAHAKKKYAMDLNPDVQARAAKDVTILQQDCTDPWPLPERYLDAVFTSNFLEHLSDKRAVVSVLSEAYRCLRPGGRFIALGPNLKYVSNAYWDFFDHYVGLTDLALTEALYNCQFEIEQRIDRFLPYTMSRGRQFPIWTLQLYLNMPFLWPIFGKQFLIVGKKSLESADGFSGK